MGLLSLRGVISALAAFSVALVAAVTLGVTLTSSLAALRSIGQDHALSLVTRVQVEAGAMVDVPQNAVELAQNITRGKDWAWPSDDPAVFEMFRNMHLSTFIEAKQRLNTYMTYFADNSYHMAGVLSEPDGSRPVRRSFFEMSVSRVSSFTAAGGNTSQQQPLGSEREAIFASNYSRLAASDPRVPLLLSRDFSTMFVGTSFWRNDVMLIARGGRRGISIGVYASEYNGIVDNYIPFVGTLFRRSDPTDTDHIYGFTVAVIGFAELAVFLRRVRATPNTHAFAIDGQGYLLGSTMAQPFSTSTPSASGQLVPTGCAVTDAVPGQSLVYRVCRERASGYGYAPLSAVMNDRALAFSPQPMVTILTVSGEVYFAASAPVPLRFGGVAIQLLLLMPQADVIGDVVASRNTAIAITCCVFVVTTAAIFVLISVLLAPLTDVAVRMEEAAALVDGETAPAATSSMSEVADLQTAFQAMDEELKRIRSFVPQSVIAAKRAAEMEDDDEGDLHTDLHSSETATSVARSRARRQSQASDTASQSSKRSVRSARSKRSGGASGPPSAAAATASAPAGFLSTCSVRASNVAIVVANARGYSRCFAHSNHADCVAVAAAVVETVSTAISSNGGVLGTFHGDHFAATFNAVCPCSAPARRAVTAALAIAAASPAGLSMRCGVASGRCLVGNLGIDGLKAHSTIGAPYMQAVALERLTKRSYGPGCRVLASHRTLTDVATAFRFRFVDIVPLPGKAAAPIGAVIEAIDRDAPGAVGSPEASGMGEWLYVLEDTTRAGDARSVLNRAFGALSSGDLEACATLLGQLRELVANSAELASDAHIFEVAIARAEALMNDAAARHKATVGDDPAAAGSVRPSAVSDLGEYYQLAFNCHRS